MFEDFKVNYPKRLGAQSWAKAQQYYKKLVNEGWQEDVLDNCAHHYALDVAMMADRQFIQQAATFLGPKKQTYLEYMDPSHDAKTSQRRNAILDAFPDVEVISTHRGKYREYPRNPEENGPRILYPTPISKNAHAPDRAESPNGDSGSNVYRLTDARPGSSDNLEREDRTLPGISHSKHGGESD